MAANVLEVLRQDRCHPGTHLPVAGGQRGANGGGVGVLGEVIVGAVGALVVLLFGFRSTLAVAPLLPIVLSTVGPRLARTSAQPGSGSRFWFNWARAVVSHPWPAAIAALLIVGALTAAAATVALASPQANSLAKSGEARAGLVALERSGFGAGAITPAEILVCRNDPVTVATRLSSIPGVSGAVAPLSWRRAGAAIVEVFPIPDGNSSAGLAVLSQVRLLRVQVGALRA